MAIGVENNMIFRTILIVLAGLVLIALITYYNNKQNTVKSEKFYDEYAKNLTNPNQPFPNDPLSSNERDVDYQITQVANDCFPKDRLTASDLLPKDAANSKWAQMNPAGQGDVKDQNFLTAGFHIGLNSVGSSLKNPNLQLRSEPIIEKVSVGPFLNSTIESSDALRRPLEIGGADC